MGALGSHFGMPWVAFGVSLGTSWTPFGVFWASFRSIVGTLGYIGCLLNHFRLFFIVLTPLYREILTFGEGLGALAGYSLGSDWLLWATSDVLILSQDRAKRSGARPF